MSAGKRCRAASGGGILMWLWMGLAVVGARELLDSSPGLGIDVSSGPVDVYLLADNTGSMSAEIADVRQNALSIFDQISRKSSSVLWGVGSYRDTRDAFVFKNNLGVTELPPKGTPENAHPILNAIKQWGAQGGGDRPEAQLYALYKIAVDFEGIGWREEASKIVVWFGDAEGHDPLNFQGESVTEHMVIKALQKEGIQVLSLDVGGLNSSGQARRISSATNGRYNFIGRPQKKRPVHPVHPIHPFPFRADSSGGRLVGSAISGGLPVASASSGGLGFASAAPALGGSAESSSAVSDAIVSGVSSLISSGP